ncbi:MAG: hypothetical protein QGF67_09375 [Lentisphaeria bacterium]|nr:hypothetical protein [Lentisphaeria bacterium]MDP7741638.1 hypothetical protein [Lentisphaeria bacterium]
MCNELPDRLADVVILVGALLALATAYVWTFGAAQGFGHCFCGPCAKSHRMFILAVALLSAWGWRRIQSNSPTAAPAL